MTRNSRYVMMIGIVMMIMAISAGMVYAQEVTDTGTYRFLMSWTSRDKTRIAEFYGEEYRDQDVPEVSLELLACPEVVDQIMAEFEPYKLRGAEVYPVKSKVYPLEELIILERPATFPLLVPEDLRMSSDNSFLWHNVYTPDQVAQTCREKDREGNRVYGPGGDVKEMDDWDWDSIQKGMEEETARRRAEEYARLPVAAILIIPILLGVGLLFIGRKEPTPV